MLSDFGKIFKVSSFSAYNDSLTGVTISGCPAGLKISSSDIELFLNKIFSVKNGFSSNKYKGNSCNIISGVLDDSTTGSPLSIMLENKAYPEYYEEEDTADRKPYRSFTKELKYNLDEHKDYKYFTKENIGHIIAGAVAVKILSAMGIHVKAFVQSIGPVSCRRFELDECDSNPLYMPDIQASIIALDYIRKLTQSNESSGAIIGCIVTGIPAGIGEPASDKLDTRLCQAVMSIDNIKGIEIGAGFAFSGMLSSQANDEYDIEIIDGHKKPVKSSNSSGGISDGISDGSPIIINAALKPLSLNKDNTYKNKVFEQYNSIVFPYTVASIESMVAVSILDLMLIGMSTKMENLLKLYT